MKNADDKGAWAGGVNFRETGIDLRFWEKTVLVVIMKSDYCDPRRGVSADKTSIFDNLEKLVRSAVPFYYDEYLPDLGGLQSAILQKADEIRPDLITFFPYTDQFSFDTLDALKKKYATYAWFGDDHWRFDDYTSRYAPHYTHVSTTDPWSISKYGRLGIRPIPTEWAAQPLSENIGPLGEGEGYEHEVSFVGGDNQFRRWLIGQLGKMGIHVSCFGMGWPNGRVSFEEMEQIFRRSRINLNISNTVNNDIRFVLDSYRNLKWYRKSSKRVEQVKARNFEIPLAGGFQLSSYALGLERHFVIGEDIAIYTTPEECAQQIRYYLENEELRKEIAARSHRKVKDGHTYLHRFEGILAGIWG